MSTEPHWSTPIESLLAEGAPALSCDVLVVGSGYGGSVAASELAAPGRSVWVMERGREYALGEFPEDIGQLPGHVRVQRPSGDAPTGNIDAVLDFRVFDEVSVLVANGLGGGSLVNAGVALPPDADLFDAPVWPREYRRGGAAHAQLFAALDEVAARLEAQPLPEARTLGKFAALDTLGRKGGCGPAAPVPLTIAGTDRINAQGLFQKGCVRCGNCFTGCNVGAKNTLGTTFIPAAARAGAEFFTGATAVEIEPVPLSGSDSPLRWRVHFARSAGLKASPGARDFHVDTHTLILSAGTLGSTELLLRSQKVGASARLGRGFSANGDAIALGWGQRTRVNGVSAPRPDSPGPSRDVGPTITGTLRTSVQAAGRHRQVLIQDGAVPSALSMAVVALGSSLSLLHRYAQGAAPGFFGDGDAVDADVLATPGAIGEHALLLLAMGRDEADGTMRLFTPEGAQRPHLEITWSDAGRAGGGHADYYAQLHAWLRKAQRDGGFDGGDYLPHPGWRPLPDELSGLAGGGQPHQLVTVHPLGGCAMADDARDGVVDRDGTVFSGPSGDRVHAGLHVLDGAILPCALGVNPFLTISALSLVAARRIRQRLDQRGAGLGAHLHARALPTRQPQAHTPLQARWGQPIELAFEERLQGHTLNAKLPAWTLAALDRQGRVPLSSGTQATRSWIAVVSLSLDLHRWLADPSIRHAARLRIYRNPFPESPTSRAEVMKTEPIWEGDGSVSLLAPDVPADASERRRRGREAFWTYLARRSTQDLGGLGDGGGLLKAARLFRLAGINHALYRELRYEFQLCAPGQAGAMLRASGRKRLAYRRDERNLWDALTRLDLRLQPAAGGDDLHLALQVDLADLVRHRRLQVTRAANTPAAIVGLAAFAAFWTRALLQTQFWSFRGLDHARLAPATVPPPGTLRPWGLAGPAFEPQRRSLRVPGGRGRAGVLDLELTRYAARRPDPAKCILLVHGLAHGSGVFTTDTVGTGNLATHFLGEGYTVWLLDHRLSNRLRYAADPHTMDDLAKHDLAAAMSVVYADNGHRPISVFAHCVGAGAFQMAVLAGHVPGGMLRAAIFHAVHPWVVPSASNRLSAALAAFYKDFLPSGLAIDPLPPVGAGGAVDTLLDRFAASLPWPEQELAEHHRHKYDERAGTAVCNRMTVFYGREWVHDNLDEATHERLGELVGQAGLEVFRQLYFILHRERLTDREGANVYLQQALVQRHWTFPTLFAHGGRNQVFDPRSAMRSWLRLNALLQDCPRPPAVRLFVREGYGHMDFLFGKHAHREVFPALSRFLAEPQQFEDRVGSAPAHVKGPNVVDGEDITDLDHQAPVAPLCGPLLQPEGWHGAQRRLVLWFEQRFDTTSQPVQPTLSVGQQRLPRVQVLPLPSQKEGADKGRNLAQSQGAGYYWVAVVDEDRDVRFSGMAPLTVTLDSEWPGVPRPVGLLDAAALGRPRFPDGPVWSHKPQLSWADGLFDRLRQLGGEAAPAAPAVPRPPLGSQVHAELALSHLPWWKRWAGEPVSAPVSFLATSCRWPGTPFERAAADQVAAAMLAHVDDPDLPADALVLLGDQIYTDATANIADTTEKSERGAQRYRDAWFAPHTARLLSSLPAWQVVDDHEFGENVEGAAGPAADAFAIGFEAAAAYQWRWHRPGQGPTLGAKSGRVERGFWHAFAIGGVPAFAADTRTERSPRDAAGWRRAALLGEAQSRALREWLLAHKDEPKFLCSGSVFGLPAERLLADPALCATADDWCGYPAAWQELAGFIARHQIRNLVFVAGDYHLSAVAELEIRAVGAAAPVRALSVVASGWNATLPFANAHEADYAWGRAVPLPAGNPDVDVWSRATLLSTSLRQFCKLTLLSGDAGWQLRVSAFDENGRMAGAQQLPL